MKCKPIPISNWRSIKKGQYTIIIAESPCEKKQGLQGVKVLPPQTFMLFLNIRGGTYFHTHNCKFPLDIVALDTFGKILSVITSYPEESKIGPMPVNTFKVLETHAGWFIKSGLNLGDMIPFILV